MQVLCHDANLAINSHQILRTCFFNDLIVKRFRHILYKNSSFIFHEYAFR